MANPNQDHAPENPTLTLCRKLGMWCVLIMGGLILCVGLPLAALRL